MDAMKVRHGPVLERAVSVAILDVVTALARGYSPHGYCRPTMTDGETTD
jgi:DNA mismatch repair ATPase MutS